MPEGMDMVILAGGKETPVRILPKKNAGQWNRLGVYDFESGNVSFTVNAKTDMGFAFADAIILNPVK